MNDTLIDAIELHTDRLNYDKENEIFSAYASDLGLNGVTEVIWVTSSESGVTKEFYFMNADKDGSNEDTYGWNFFNKETKIRLLIIND